MENNFYIYFHINKTTGKVFYVGKGKDKRAWSKVGRTDYWKRIVNKYGYEVDIIHTDLSEDRAFKWEKLYISMFGRENLCNLTDGGEGMSGFIPSEEQKIKISNSLKGHKHSEETKQKMKNKVFTDEQRKKISEAGKGRKHTEEAKLKMREKLKGRPAHNKGKKMSEEQKEKLSKIHKGRIIDDEWRKKLSEAKKGKSIPKTEETRKKMSEAAKLRWSK